MPRILIVKNPKIINIPWSTLVNACIQRCICMAMGRDLNSYCITRHMHYKRPQQCFLIKNILSSTKENNRRHSYVNKRSWRFFSHIYINRLGGKSQAASVLKPFVPAVRSFLCTETLQDDIFLGWVGKAQYLSLDAFIVQVSHF